MFPRLPRVLRAPKHTSLTPPAPLVGMPSSQAQPLAQGPPSLVEGLRAEGSADEVLAIALAALVYNTRCGGKDDHGRAKSEGDVAIPIRDSGSLKWPAGLFPTRCARCHCSSIVKYDRMPTRERHQQRSRRPEPVAQSNSPNPRSLEVRSRTPTGEDVAFHNSQLKPI